MTPDPLNLPFGDTRLHDVRQLRLLDLLWRTGSVTRSAEALGQSQPTVSIWLAQLRARHGDALFVRTAQGMVPTAKAQAMIGPVREALDALRRLDGVAPAFDAARSTRCFRICMTDASHVTLLPQLLGAVRARAPAVRLAAARIDEDTGPALQTGRADLAIGLVPWLESGFYQQVLFPQDWVCLVNRQHPRLGASQAATLTLPAYESEAHIGIVAGTGAQLLHHALQAHQVTRRVVLELPGFLGLAAMLSSTDLVATLPRQIGETLARQSGLSVFDCPVPVPGFTVKQHWHERFHQDPANRWLRELAAELLTPA